MFRYALVTGATSGIGHACTVLLLSQGIPVIATGRDKKALAELAHQGAVTLAHDLQQGAAPLLECIEAEAPDLVIHAAGFGAYGPALIQGENVLHEMLHLHVEIAWELTLATARRLKKQQRSGVICHLSSFAGELPTPGMASYGASKACLTHLCQSLDFELAKEGIRVLVCCPGMVNTPFAMRAAKRPFVHGRWTINADTAAKKIWQQIVTRKGKTIIDWRYRLIRLLLPCVPKRFIEQAIFDQVTRR